MAKPVYPRKPKRKSKRLISAGFARRAISWLHARGARYDNQPPVKMLIGQLLDDIAIPTAVRALIKRANKCDAAVAFINFFDSLPPASQPPMVSYAGRKKGEQSPPNDTVSRATPSRQEFYDSRAWLALRYRALLLHGRRCMCCGATAAEGAIIHVDHIKPRSLFPDLELEISNLQVLCKDCNLGKSNRDETDFRSIPAAE